MLANSSDPRVKRTRQLLQKTLTDLMHEKSFEDISVQEIAARAEVNRATFYDHFEDKFALLKSLLYEEFQTRLNTKLPAKPDFNEENLRQLTLVVCEFLIDFTRRTAHQRGTCLSVPPIEPLLQSHIHSVILGWIHTSNAETIAMVTSWAIFGSAFRWSQNHRKMTAVQMADQILPLLLHGVAEFMPVPASNL